MKVTFVLVGLLALGLAAPQPRKIFHEHFEDFLELIMDEAGDEIEHIMGHYIEFDEFRATMDYVTTANFKDIIYEMESLPEFKAVTEYLENDNIDILYFLDRFNEMIEDGFARPDRSRHAVSGTDFTSFVNDCIEVFPSEKLAALFEEKKEEDEEFRVAMENLQSEEWQEIFDALWANEVFQNEVQVLADNGVNLEVFLKEIVAVFGQK